MEPLDQDVQQGQDNIEQVEQRDVGGQADGYVAGGQGQGESEEAGGQQGRQEGAEPGTVL